MDQKLARLRKDIIFDATLCHQSLTFHTTWGLFSPREIDAGTHLLLEHIKTTPTDDCLDLGCGYGPIGLTLAKLSPRGESLLVDKDFVAVDYARQNITRNNLPNAKARLSNGFAHIEPDRRFHVIASNIPAKTGKELLTILLSDTWQHLHPQGKLYVVTVNGLRQFMKRYMNDIFGNYKKLKQGTHYTVAMCHK